MTSGMRCGVRWRGKSTVPTSQRTTRSLSIPEQLDKKPTKGDVADLRSARGSDAGDALQLQRRVIPEHDLRRVLDGAPPRIDELLDEDLAEYAVRLLAEDGAEDDGYAVGACLNVDGLLLAVMHRHNLAAGPHALWRLLRRVLGRLLLEAVVLVVGSLEGGGHGVALQEGHLHNEGIAGLCEVC